MNARLTDFSEHTAIAGHAGSPRTSNGADRHVDASWPALFPLTQALPDPEVLLRALAATQHQLAAALRQMDAAQRQASLVKLELKLLAQEVTQVRRFAHHDPLTGLPNRILLLDRFNQVVARAAREQKQVAMLFIDLDGFKCINDRLGHTAGDRLLQQVATRLLACVRASDTPCRFGGDEFVVLLPEFEGHDGAVAVTDKIRARLAAPYLVDGIEITITASLGMAIYPVDGRQYLDLIHASDLDMYRNKARSTSAPRIGQAASNAGT